MRGTLALMFLALAACSEGQSAEEKAKADAAAVAEVEANQEPPPEALSPQGMRYPDFEKYDLFGAGCNFVPEGSALEAVLLAQPDRGYMKRDGEILQFAADKGSEENPLGTWTKYDSKDYSLTLTLTTRNGTPSGMETTDFPAELVVVDSRDRVVFRSSGIAQCGS